MSEEKKEESTMSGIKKAIISGVTLLVTALTGLLVNKISGGEKKEAAPAPAAAVAPSIIINNSQSNSGGGAAPAKKLEEKKDGWTKKEPKW